MKRVKPMPGMVVEESVEFEPGIYVFNNGEGIRIAASNITVKGNHTVLLGPGEPGDLNSFSGVGISAEGQHHVTVEGLIVHGFNLGLKIVDGEYWTVQNNDFSYNYSDETYGWGEGFPYGAVLLLGVNHSQIIGNSALNNWNGLSLRDSNCNEVKNNRFSHCSNVCLKLWNSSQNRIEDNAFSYGLRIQPGETHARDSTCALIESGSNHNHFLRNDFTHGGDGVFIRPLNGWHSEGNYFEANDASFAHNNAWECWSPNNTFIRNKGNYSSYGFWMGGSDGTTMIGNEAAYNGTLHKNAPESDFGHAGIAVVHGSSSHFRLIGNLVHHNHGAGLALGFKPQYPAMHWVISRNWFGHNRIGMYFRHANHLYLFGNELGENLDHGFLEGPEVSNLNWLTAENMRLQEHGDESACLSPNVHVRGYEKQIGPRQFVVSVGRDLITELQLSEDRNEETVKIEWVSSTGEVTSGSTCSWNFEEPGFYRLSVTAHDGTSLGLDWVHVYAVDTEQREIGTDGLINVWKIAASDSSNYPNDACVALDETVSIVGDCSVRCSTTAPVFSVKTFCSETWNDAKQLQVWLRIRHHAVFGLRDTTARIRIGQSDDDYVEYQRQGHWFEGIHYNEAWQDWYYLKIPCRGDEKWKRTDVGSGCMNSINYIEFLHEDQNGEPGRIEFWIDGLQMTSEP